MSRRGLTGDCRLESQGGKRTILGQLSAIDGSAAHGRNECGTVSRGGAVREAPEATKQRAIGTRTSREAGPTLPGPPTFTDGPSHGPGALGSRFGAHQS